MRGRRQEREVLEGLVHAARAGRSAALVVHGEPGIGKSALLGVLADAPGCRVVRAAGVESQMELAFAGLHELCRPLLDGLDRLPEPQAHALGTAFGLRSGGPPDRFLIGLAALSLLADAAREQPLVCLVDDAQWLDQASVQALTFVARRLAAESVALVVAVRTGTAERPWAGLPRLAVRGLPDGEAGELLAFAVTGALDPRVRHRILAETHGNPLALLELPRLYSAAELAFGPQPGDVATLIGRMEEGFRRRLGLLPDPCRLLLAVAAAEPLGDVALLWRAAESLGVGPGAAGPAQEAGLMELRDTVRFRHPLVRSVAYRSATASARRAAHRALADATDPEQDPDRRAWHRAQAATGPDEAVAAELERCAGDALAHGGLAAAAAFLERAAVLTPDAAVRVRRELDAARALMNAGSFDAARDLLTVTAYEPPTALQRARLDVLRAQLEFASERGNEALPLLVAAARRLEPLDLELALDCHLDALTAALFAGRLAPGGGAAEVARAARRARMPARPRPGDLLLQAMAALYADGYVAAVPSLARAAAAFDDSDLSLEEGVRFLWLAAVVGNDLWDERAWDRMTDRHLRLVREAGALSALPLALNTRVFVDLFAGDLAAAAALVEEIGAVTEAVEAPLPPYGAVGLAAFRGREEEAAPLLAAALKESTARGAGIGVSLVHWAQAMLCNGLGRYREACQDGRLAAAHPEEMAVGTWGLAELIEAAVRAGERETAAAAVGQLTEMTRASGTDWALGVAARSEAQLLDGGAAEDRYREAIDRLGRTAVRTELARAQLLYGEWLRRAGRRLEARDQLRTAYDALTAMGVEAFAGRAHRELSATGETVRKRSDDTRHDLTAQELHIARLAAEGLTNPEIGAELFISPRTVEWHLRKVFAKLGISARRELRDVRGPTLSSPS
ncbi:helix-turn-helix transcriptional regulator [Jiangella ureilytica]|uniref:Helix-turn-helix transcriptional regulator n=1 Tax=Jiangella ureilytica TaxID=2530374 RepID=A0A4R4RL01_9ACTN|nr:helix-turn-helix transcriptional regulator [Jiangella ureilytica]